MEDITSAVNVNVLYLRRFGRFGGVLANSADGNGAWPDLAVPLDKAANADMMPRAN